MTLTGPWRFCPDPFDEGIPNGWFAADYDDSRWAEGELPCVFDRLLPALAGYEGSVWFRKRITPAAGANRLRGEGASYRSVVWVNGAPVGENADPFLPFEFALDRSLQPDAENVLVLRVDNTRRPGDVPGPQRGWRPYGGVLRTVSLVPDEGIEAVEVEAEADGRLRVRAAVRLPSLPLQLHDPDGALLWEGQPSAVDGRIEASARIDRPALWSPDAPQLHALTVGPRTLRVGFRTVEVKEGRIHLNGQPLFLRGFNRHEDSPSRDMAADPAQARADLTAMQRLGANFVRLCHYPHDPATLDLCDELGLLAMAEIPLYWWGDRDEDHAAKLDNAKRQLTRLIERDRNHPSVIFWSVSNETADGDETVAEGNRALIRLAKSLDPTRLAAHVSDRWQTHPNFDEDDAICVNAYPTWFPREDGQPAFSWRDELAKLHARWPDKPIVVAEFGHPALAGVHDGRLSEEAQAQAIVEQLSDMARLPALCGATIWCWADHPWPDNAWIRSLNTSPFGVVGRDRTPKAAHEAVGKRLGAWLSSPQLHMRRTSLENLPPVSLPAGYRLRTAGQDDAEGLGRVLIRAFPEVDWTIEKARAALLEDASVKTVFVIEHETDGIVATASARHLPERYPGAGYVHWVGGDPDHRGKRLGLLVSLAVLHEFAGWGCTAAVLDTDDFRAPAIKTYLALDFAPVFTHASHPERWTKLTAAL